MKFPSRPLSSHLAIREPLLAWLDQPARAFSGKTKQDLAAWQRGARKAFDQCLGQTPPPIALRPQVFEEKQLPGYHRTTFTLDTAPGLKALCWLCLPDGNRDGKAHATMIATPGHGIGALDILGMDARGQARPEGQGYQKDYALQAVRLGYNVLVIEPLGFGLRRDLGHMTGKGGGESGCQAANNVATMLGTTLARLRINDVQRTIDYLETRTEVDNKRIGMMGISGGGQMTLWTTALEKRLSVAIVSGYLNSFRHSVMAMHHCICNFVPGLARQLDMTDLAALIAPRPLLIEAGTKDPIFPIAATRAAVQRVRQTYTTCQAADRFAADIFVGDHQWSGRKTKAFLARWL